MKDASGKKQKVEFSLATIKSNPASKRELEGLIEEIIVAEDQIKDKRAHLTSIYHAAKDFLGVPRKILRKLVKENRDPGVIEAESNELFEVQQIAEVLSPAPVAQFIDTED